MKLFVPATGVFALGRCWKPSTAGYLPGCHTQVDRIVGVFVGFGLLFWACFGQRDPTHLITKRAASLLQPSGAVNFNTCAEAAI